MGGMDFFFLEAHALIRDHPCLRGEYFTGWLVLKYPTGSLPLTRGILRAPFPAFADVGITPACAGNTTEKPLMYWSLWDHPRLCGEYSAILSRSPWIVGSPPLTRGIPDRIFFPYAQRRITPAYAGNTFCMCAALFWYMNHPRLRGEYLHPTLHPNGAMGSPPLTRGILCYVPFVGTIGGITPAYAGNT